MMGVVGTVLLVLVFAGLLVLMLGDSPRGHRPRPSSTPHDRPAPPPGPGSTSRQETTMAGHIGDQGSCTTKSAHDHRWTLTKWRGTSLERATEVHVPVDARGVVELSEGAVEELLVAAGFERADQ